MNKRHHPSSTTTLSSPKSKLQLWAPLSSFDTVLDFTGELITRLVYTINLLIILYLCCCCCCCCHHYFHFHLLLMLWAKQLLGLIYMLYCCLMHWLLKKMLLLQLHVDGWFDIWSIAMIDGFNLHCLFIIIMIIIIYNII